MSDSTLRAGVRVYARRLPYIALDGDQVGSWGRVLGGMAMVFCHSAPKTFPLSSQSFESSDASAEMV